MKKIITLPLIAMGLALGSAGSFAGTTAETIAAKYQLSEKAFAENDVQALVEQFYADDVYVVGEGSKAVVGITDLTPVLKQLVEGASKIEMSSEYADYKSEDTVYDFVNYHVYPADGSEDFNVRSLLVWKKIKGDWRVSADMYTFGQYK